MVKEGAILGFVLVLLGAIGSIFLAINFLSPYPLGQILAIYYAAIGALLLPMAFRLKRRRTLQSASWISLILGIFSLNILAFVGGLVGLVHWTVRAHDVLLPQDYSQHSIPISHHSPPYLRKQQIIHHRKKGRKN